MILIIGSTKDDTLYFESVITNIRKEKLYNRYELTFGTIFKQDIVLVNGVYTGYEATPVVSYILDNYFVILVFIVGKATAFSKDLNVGDVAISKRLFLGDVDLIEETEAKLGQIPNFPFSYETQQDVIGYMRTSFETRTFVSYKLATFISSNIAYSNETQLQSFKVGDSLFGHSDKIVFDSLSGGVAVACQLFNTPFIAVKVVSRMFGKRQSAKNYSIVLKNYASVGKAIVTTIGDIGRNDIIRGEE